MRLPPEYPEIVAAGVRALRAVGVRLRLQAARRPEAPELWLMVRNVTGLAERLAEIDAWKWRTGFADMSVTGQDLGVVDELLAVSGAASPYRDGPGTERGDHAAALARLREFLGAYNDGAFELDDPAPPDSESGTRS